MSYGSKAQTMSYGSHVVGHKIVQYVRAVKRDYGGHWEITHHQLVHELHATKGWRFLRHDTKVHTARKLPSREMWQGLVRRIFVRNPDLGTPRPKLSRGLMQLNGPALLKAQLRHRERRRDIERDANLARLAQP